MFTKDTNKIGGYTLNELDFGFVAIILKIHHLPHTHNKLLNSLGILKMDKFLKNKTNDNNKKNTQKITK